MTRNLRSSSPRSSAVRRATAVLALVVVTAAAAGCGGASGQASDDGTPTSTAAIETTTTTAAPTTTTTAAPTTTTTNPAEQVFRAGSSGPEVQELQGQLEALGYRPGAVDGNYGAETASAVMAFQKHEGLGRDGAAGPETRGAIAAGSTGAGPRTGGPGLEVDLDRQIMFVTLDDGTTTIINVSSGNNQSYVHPNGGTAMAVTPTGSYAVGRKIDAPEIAPLGTLYRPMYFKGGFAVHGSTSVPGYPASHGCVRVSNVDEDWLFPQTPVGTSVVLYGGPSGLDAGTDTPAA